MRISLKMSENAEREGGELLSKLLGFLNRDGELVVRTDERPFVRKRGRWFFAMDDFLRKQAVEALILNLFRLRSNARVISRNQVASFLNREQRLNFTCLVSGLKIRINAFLTKDGFGFVCRPFGDGTQVSISAG